VEVEDIYFGKKPQQLGHFRVFWVSFLAAESKDVDLTCRSCSAQEPLQGLPCCCRHWYFGACRPASDSCDFLHRHGQNSQQTDDLRIEGDSHSPNIPLVRNPWWWDDHTRYMIFSPMHTQKIVKWNRFSFWSLLMSNSFGCEPFWEGSV
jgi:hypothetical protein